MATKNANQKAQRLRDFILGYKRKDVACKYCPTHPWPRACGPMVMVTIGSSVMLGVGIQ